MGKKPKFDEVTGCTHIENVRTKFGGYRACAACGACMPKDIDELRMNYCYRCGETFDHFDDDPEGGEDDG